MEEDRRCWSLKEFERDTGIDQATALNFTKRPSYAQDCSEVEFFKD
jgi:hypothetical protein